MFEIIKRKLLEYCDYPEDKLTENTEIIRDLCINSLDIMLMLGDLEDEYNIKFEQSEITNVITVGDFTKLVIEKIKK